MWDRILPLLPLLPPPATNLKGLQIPGTIEVRRSRFPTQTTNCCRLLFSNNAKLGLERSINFKLQRKFGLLLGWTLPLLKSDQRGPERSCNLSKFYPVAEQALNIQNKFWRTTKSRSQLTFWFYSTSHAYSQYYFVVNWNACILPLPLDCKLSEGKIHVLFILILPPKPSKVPCIYTESPEMTADWIANQEKLPHMRRQQATLCSMLTQYPAQSRWVTRPDGAEMTLPKEIDCVLGSLI